MRAAPLQPAAATDAAGATAGVPQSAFIDTAFNTGAFVGGSQLPIFQPPAIALELKTIVNATTITAATNFVILLLL